MKKIDLCLLLFFLSARLLAQIDSFPAVTRILPEAGNAYNPVFSPFCSSRCWLNDRAFDIPTRRFVPKDSASCVPNSSKRIRHGDAPTDPNPTYLKWQIDPYDSNFLWTYEYRHDDMVPWQDRKDTLILWRYDRNLARQDSFVSLLQGEMTIGKQGVWVTNLQELVLLDRHTGQVINRAGNPDGGGTRFMSLQPWGDDLVVSDRWLYLVNQHKYVPFFPLPTEMEGCKSPEKVEFHGEICLSRTLEEGSKYAYHILAPGYRPIRLPFKPNHVSSDHGVLALNPPLAWLCQDDTLIGFDYSTGELNRYPGSSSQPLYYNQEGRFLGFYSELGLSFFDKYTCQFQVLQLPFGHKMPRNFTSNHQFIFLTYENHWEIIDFSKLEPAFHRSSVLDEYKVFEREWYEQQQGARDDFYKTYEVYLTIYSHYKNSENPKIKAAQEQFASMIAYPLFVAPDSVMERVAKDFDTGRFDPSVSCKIALGLLRYYGKHGRLEAAYSLLGVLENEPCIHQEMDEHAQIIQLVKTTKHQLDSLAQLNLSADEKLYATGQIWFEFSLKKRWFQYTDDPRRDLEQAYDYFRKLIQQYPNSPWADNAAYALFHYVDYQASTTDDETPNGDDRQAYLAFTQFLKDYPHADQKPTVLLRLAIVMIRGLSDWNFDPATMEQVAGYLETIAQEYPEFAKKESRYSKALGDLNWKNWSVRWSLKLAVTKDTIRFQDTIQLRLGLRNHSNHSQTLDSNFLLAWREGLRLHLHQIRDKNCDQIWGDFPLIPVQSSFGTSSITLAPGATYEESFFLAQKSINKNDKPGQFELVRKGTYLYNMSYRHPYLNWLWMDASGGRFFIE